MDFWDPKWLDLGLKVINMLAAAVVIIYSWINSRSKASLAAVDELAKQHREDLSRLEANRQVFRQEIEKRIETGDRVLADHLEQMQTELIERVDTVETDLRRLSNQVQGMPSKKDIVRIHERLNEVADSQSTVAGAVREQGKTLRSIENYLINKGA